QDDRYLHVFGPTTPNAFARWAGIAAREGVAAFNALHRTLMPVRTPLGDAWILSRDEPAYRANARPAAPARLLPSGDAYFLLQGAARELLVPDAKHGGDLGRPGVWPGAALVGGEMVGGGRRSREQVTIGVGNPLSRAARGVFDLPPVRLQLG